MNEQIKQRIAQLNNGEVPNGYEKTEIGTFPVGWKTTTLDKLLEFKNGVNADKEKYNSGVKMISVMDILSDSPIYYDKIKGQVDIDEKTLDTYSVTYGDILFQRSSETFEDAGKSNVYLDKDRTATYSGFVIRGKKKAHYNPYFLNEALRIGQVRNQIIRNAAGSQHINVGQDSLAKIIVPLASDVEQSKIAEILMKWDEAIELQEQYIKSLKRKKTSTMKTLFEFSSEYVLPFKDAVKPYKYTKELQTSQYHEAGTIPVVDQGKSNIVAYTDEEDYVIHPPSKGLLLFGDHTTEVKFINYDFAVGGDGVKMFEENDVCQLKYVYYYLVAFPFLIEGYKRHYSILRNKPIKFPTVKGKIDKKTMSEIVCILSQFDEMINLQIQKTEKLKKQRKALQQYLLNGIVRV